MSITPEDLSQVAHLSKLSITSDDLVSHTKQMNKIIEFIEQLNEVNTNVIKPMAHPLKMTQRLRLDEVTQSDRHQDFQAIAPKVENTFYLVPTVLE